MGAPGFTPGATPIASAASGGEMLLPGPEMHRVGEALRRAVGGEVERHAAGLDVLAIRRFRPRSLRSRWASPRE